MGDRWDDLRIWKEMGAVLGVQGVSNDFKFKLERSEFIVSAPWGSIGDRDRQVHLSGLMKKQFRKMLLVEIEIFGTEVQWRRR